LIVGERTSFVQPLYDRFHFNLMRLADHMTVNSIVRLKQLQKDFGFLRNKISFFPNIIDLDTFSFDQKRSQLKTCKIGFVGRIAPEKNIVNLIKAVKLLTDNNKDVQLLLYGDTRNEAYLEEVNSLIANANLQDSVVFKGKSDAVQEAYKSIDLLCLISDYEGFSNVISEALCSGVPVITSDVEENKYLIEDGVNGYVVDHKDPESIAKGIEKYLQLDEGSKDKMSKENRKKAEVLFDKEVLYSKYMKIINELIAE
ncbi:MAG: glycosyltransferase family 4 protein, partial [Flavobacteriaceae bacterium]|nr:glycosyltransferase family 4 protein [Flavobacteriaceae bacterium]